eukprot:Skav232165  [mRNA]  locus=scaffold1040:591096:593957:- [translate_table: standard]
MANWACAVHVSRVACGPAASSSARRLSTQIGQRHCSADMSKVIVLSALLGLVFGFHALGFVAPPGHESLSVPRHAGTVHARPALSGETVAPVGVATGVYGLALLATAAAGVLARSKRSRVMVHYMGQFKPVVGDRYTYTNDAGFLADGTPINTAGNNSVRKPAPTPPAPTPTPPAPTPAPPAPTPAANSVGYLPDGTAMNAAGNAVNHPDRMQPDTHVSGSPLPKSVYSADCGYFVDGTDLEFAGNNYFKKSVSPPVAPTSFTSQIPATAPPVAASFVSSGEAFYGRQGDYSMQRDAHADFEFLNDVGFLAAFL